MKALICGSFAFDTIMIFNDQFKNHILPDQVHILNVSFLVPEMRREFGGCAGNIAYNLRLLEIQGEAMATIGEDFAPYAKWMDQHQISRSYLTEIPQSYTAQAYITTDQDDNQITAFHPGAMNESHQNKITQTSDIGIGLISPDGRQGMIEHAAQFKAANIPFIFDPGQGLPMFNGEELNTFVDQATWIACNDYEAQLLQKRTGKTLAQLSQEVEAVIITKGGEGSTIYVKDQVFEIPAVAVTKVVDPTGCGDAYRAGLLYGLINKLDWQTTGQIAALMGAIKIEQAGTQNHSFSLSEFKTRFETEFKTTL